MFKIKIAGLILIIIAAGMFVRQQRQTTLKETVQQAVATAKVNATKAAAKVLASHCKANKIDKKVVVSISQQHMWSCSGSDMVYQTAVTTGAVKLGNATPTGTWQVYAKQTDRYLSGSDSHGSWNDYVNYWMPYDGDFGFHDATWQTLSFGSPKYASKGSHGCVRLPLAAMKWLYNWAPVGTTITVET